MGREIEFRGKRKENGEWVYGDLSTGDYPSITWWERIEDVDGCPSFELNCADVEPESVGQYTGLKDKNDKKIFDGDILHWNKGFDMYSAVEYQDGSFWSGETLLADSLEEEVVGNIYDNADLIAEV